jgi:hypothetical protein
LISLKDRNVKDPLLIGITAFPIKLSVVAEIHVLEICDVDTMNGKDKSGSKWFDSIEASLPKEDSRINPISGFLEL